MWRKLQNLGFETLSYYQKVRFKCHYGRDNISNTWNRNTQINLYFIELIVKYIPSGVPMDGFIPLVGASIARSDTPSWDDKGRDTGGRLNKTFSDPLERTVGILHQKDEFKTVSAKTNSLRKQNKKTSRETKMKRINTIAIKSSPFFFNTTNRQQYWTKTRRCIRSFPKIAAHTHRKKDCAEFIFSPKISALATLKGGAENHNPLIQLRKVPDLEKIVEHYHCSFTY